MPMVEKYLAVRRRSVEICNPLLPDDYGIQSMPEASPPKWHLAHTSWFFETFVLAPTLGNDFQPFRPSYAYLFNSYYKSLGSHQPRAERGLLSRPALEEILLYREHVDRGLLKILKEGRERELPEDICFAITLGLNHEEQHQELLLTDILHAFYSNPLRPAYRPGAAPAPQETSNLEWIEYGGGVKEIGHAGDGFRFDNEAPRHRVFLQGFRRASRPVTNGEFAAFIADGGYDEPRLWLSDGWDMVQKNSWRAPFYWSGDEDRMMTLNGMQPIVAASPVGYLSYYEADAFARWAGKRLPTEAEWETAAASAAVDGNFFESGLLHPSPAVASKGRTSQLFGDVWEWTSSPYVPYPRFRPDPGNFAEYNGKFMCNQMVLRGGSCLTPRGHVRPTYRNFFPPQARWQCAGFRLAEDL